jgi:large subunit ribosomal protein L13
LKTTTVPELRKTKPEQIVINAVYGMLPSNKLRDEFLSRFKVYAGGKHPHVNIKFENS